MFPYRLRIGLAALTALALTAPTLAAQHERTITVGGEGRATVARDLAVVEVGVIAQGPTARAALDRNSAAMAKVLATLANRFSIAERDIETSLLDLRAEYERDPNGRPTGKVAGFHSTNQVRLRVRTLNKLGELLDAVVGAGANRIAGVRFTTETVADALDAARRLAVADARRRAELYAAAAGADLGEVVSIREQLLPEPGPRAAQAFAAEAAAAVPVASGETELRVSITVVFALDGD